MKPLRCPAILAERKTDDDGRSAKGFDSVRAHRHAVNNAGICIAKPFNQYTDADYPAILRRQHRRLLSHHATRRPEMENKDSGHYRQLKTSLVGSTRWRGVPPYSRRYKRPPAQRPNRWRSSYAKGPPRYPRECGFAGSSQTDASTSKTHGAAQSAAPGWQYGERTPISSMRFTSNWNLTSFVTGEIPPPFHVDGGQSAGQCYCLCGDLALGSRKDHLLPRNTHMNRNTKKLLYTPRPTSVAGKAAFP